MATVSSQKIYVDMDDVVSRTTEVYAGIVEKEFGKQVRFEQILSFDLKISFGLTDKEFHYFFDLIHQPDFLLGFEPVAGSVETLANWTAAGHCIDIVTGRPAASLAASLEWLAKNQVPFDSFTLVDKYNRAGNGKAISKKELSRRTYDLAVEDSRDMALFLAQTMGVPVALYDRPWNALPVDHDKVVRCFSWQEIRTSQERWVAEIPC